VFQLERNQQFWLPLPHVDETDDRRLWRGKFPDYDVRSGGRLLKYRQVRILRTECVAVLFPPKTVRALAMTLIRIVALVFLAMGTGLPAVMASPARFWFSSSSTVPGMPSAPLIPGLMGASRTLHIWAQPATVNAALPYNVNTNRFRTLRNLSLNVVTDEPILDFVDGTFIVYNPELNGMRRFEFISDSLTPSTDVSAPLTSNLMEADITDGLPDAIQGLQAFSIAASGFSGLGHSPNHPTAGCHPADPFCAVTSDGSPAWLVASIAFKTLSSTGTAPIYLQIGTNGMTYLGDPAQASQITFGVNSAGSAPVYNSQLLSHRDTTLDGDQADITISAVAPIPGDFNLDSVVDAADYVEWRKGLGTIYIPSQYFTWRTNFGRSSASGASAHPAATVPELTTWALFVLGIFGVSALWRAARP
jgi:hypothetical protein